FFLVARVLEDLRLLGGADFSVPVSFVEFGNRRGRPLEPFEFVFQIGLNLVAVEFALFLVGYIILKDIFDLILRKALRLAGGGLILALFAGFLAILRDQLSRGRIGLGLKTAGD